MSETLDTVMPVWALKVLPMPVNAPFTVTPRLPTVSEFRRCQCRHY